MTEKQASPQSAKPPSTIRGKTFVLAVSSPNPAGLDEPARLIELLGGEVVGDITPGLDYLVVLHRRPDRLTDEGRDAVRRATGRLEAALHSDPDDGGADFVQLHIDASGRSVRAYSSEPDGTRSCQADTLSECLLELAQLWPDADLYLETLVIETRCD